MMQKILKLVHSRYRSRPEEIHHSNLEPLPPATLWLPSFHDSIKEESLVLRERLENYVHNARISGISRENLPIWVEDNIVEDYPFVLENEDGSTEPIVTWRYSRLAIALEGYLCGMRLHDIATSAGITAAQAADKYSEYLHRNGRNRSFYLSGGSGHSGWRQPPGSNSAWSYMQKAIAAPSVQERQTQLAEMLWQSLQMRPLLTAEDFAKLIELPQKSYP